MSNSETTNGNQSTLRLSPELAAEIGLNESIVLLQLDYLNEVSNVERDGIKWSYNTLDELKKKYFIFFSKATLSRTINSLKDSGYIKIGNYNRLKFDRKQWFHVDMEKCSKLRGFIKFHFETSMFHSDVIDDSKMKHPFTQNETTIEENHKEIQEEIQREEEIVAVATVLPEPAQEAKPAKKKTESIKQPPDSRANSAAISAVRKFLPKEKYPNKLIWDKIISTLGDEPDLARLEECATAWAGVSQNMFNLAWVFEWYVGGIPERAVRGSPKSKADAVIEANILATDNWLEKYEGMNDQPRPN